MQKSIVVLCVGLIAVCLGGCSGPVGPFAGGRLSGEENTTPVRSWNFATEIETVQLETNPDEPYSVNTWIGVVDEQAYIPTSLILGAENPTERKWVQNIMSDANARLRIDGTVFNVRLERVLEAVEREQARQVLMSKYAEDATDHSDAAWIYRVEPR